MYKHRTQFVRPSAPFPLILKPPFTLIKKKLTARGAIRLVSLLLFLETAS